MIIRSPMYVSDLQSLSRRSPQLMGAVDKVEQDIAALKRTMGTPLFEEVVDILVQTGTLTWVAGKEYLLRSGASEQLRARIAILPEINALFAIAIESSVESLEE